jgi:hypothetical protein
MGLYGHMGLGEMLIIGRGGGQKARFGESLKRAKSLFGACKYSQDYEASGGAFWWDRRGGRGLWCSYMVYPRIGTFGF